MRSRFHVGFVVTFFVLGSVLSTPAKIGRGTGKAAEQLREALRVNEDAGNSFLNQEKRKIEKLQELPMECEGAATRLDFAVIDSAKTPGSHLIIIARLGKGEASGRLNDRRLAAIEEYILRRGSDLKYVLAEGRRINGLGRVELYVAGKLTEVLPYKRNAISHCESERQ